MGASLEIGGNRTMDAKQTRQTRRLDRNLVRVQVVALSLLAMFASATAGRIGDGTIPTDNGLTQGS